MIYKYDHNLLDGKLAFYKNLTAPRKYTAIITAPYINHPSVFVVGEYTKKEMETLTHKLDETKKSSFVDLDSVLSKAVA